MDLVFRCSLLAQSPNLVWQLAPWLVVFFVFYFLLILPQRREQSRREQMLSAVKKNDKVLTSGGLYGVVTNVDREADQVTLRVDEDNNTRIRVTLASIVRVMGDEAKPSKATDAKNT